MPLPRDNDLPIFTYHRHAITYAGTATALAGTAIAYAKVPAILPTTAVFGIAEFDAVPGGDLTIAIAGITQTISGAAIAIGDPISFDATSRAVPSVAGNLIFGRALSVATGPGQKVQILITRGGTA